MPKTTVSAKLGKEKDAPSVEVQYDFGDDLDQAVELFGEQMIYSKAKSQITVDLQAHVRTMLKAGKTAAEIQKAVDAWKPGVRQPSKSKAEKIREQFAGLSPEDKKALIASLK